MTWPDVGSAIPGRGAGGPALKRPLSGKAPAPSPRSLGMMAEPSSTCLDQAVPQTSLLPQPSSLWLRGATSANAFNPGHSFQLAVADSNVPLLGFILAFNDFYVGFDGVKGIAWECFVWTLVFSALSC